MAVNRTPFTCGWASDKGRIREVNEDACFVSPGLGVWAVADGMGGHEHGKLASEVVVSELSKVQPAATAMELRDRCEGALVTANQRMRTIASANGGGVIGSTVAMLLVFDAFYACVWCGDSRIYLVRGGEIGMLTRDHTELADLVAQGVLSAEEAQRWPRRNVITRALGVAEEPELEMSSGPLEPGDTFVLCSDGLTAHVSSPEILEAVGAMAPQEACDHLVSQTLTRGATDNVTVVVARRDVRETTLVHPQRNIWDDIDGE